MRKNETDPAVDSKHEEISLARKLIGFPLTAVGAWIVAAMFYTDIGVPNAVALFGGGAIFYGGYTCALGWRVTRKWRFRGTNSVG